MAVLTRGNEAPTRKRPVKIVQRDGEIREVPFEQFHEKIVEKTLLESELSDAVKCVACKERVGHPRTKKGKIGKGPRYCDECVSEYVCANKKKWQEDFYARNAESERAKARVRSLEWARLNPDKKRENARIWAERKARAEYRKRPEIAALLADLKKNNADRRRSK
jgi:hypothetical protein